MAIKRTWILAGCYACGGVVALWLAGVSPAQAQDNDVPPKLKEKFRKLDTNKDGAIQKSEFPQEKQELFARGDLNNDGKLSVREAIRLHVTEEGRKKTAEVQKIRQRFDKADKDKDGVITKGEFPAPEMLFAKFDRDGDGKVTFPEALAFSIEEEIAKIFEKHDADMSGTLSTSEVPAGKARLAVLAADADGNGQVTGKEAFELIYTVRLAASKTLASGGATQPAPSKEALAKAGVLGMLATRFKQLDTNADGRLSAAEWPGSRQLRERFDIDGDNAVDAQEVAVRAAFAKRLGSRAEALKPRAVALGQQQALAVVALEIKGLFGAGRYEEASRLLDQVELRLARVQTQKQSK